MFYLFLGNAIVGLFIVNSISLEDEISAAGYALVVALSAFMDFLPVLPYFVGRYFSKQSQLHWETLLGVGVIIGIFNSILIPRMEIEVLTDLSQWYLPAALFFAAAFIPAKIERWRT